LYLYIDMSHQSRSHRHSFFFFFQAEDGIRDATVTGVQTCALPISTVEQHAAESREVGGRREHPRVAGDTPEQARAPIVRLALEQVAVGVVRRRHAALHGVAGAERRVAQVERAEEHALEVAVEALAAHASDDLAEQDEAGV